MQDMQTGRGVHNFEINTETLISVIGFLGAILLLVDVIALR